RALVSDRRCLGLYRGHYQVRQNTPADWRVCLRVRVLKTSCLAHLSNGKGGRHAPAPCASTLDAATAAANGRLLTRGLERDAEDKAALHLRRNLSVHDHGVELLGLRKSRMVDLKGERLPH